MRRYTCALGGVLAVLFAASAAHATAYDDVGTDFSNAFGTPTVLSLTSGSNTITGRTGTASGSTDLDYFRINVPAGAHLTSITLNSTDTPSATFLGMEAGTVFTSPPTTTQAQMLGFVHFQNNATFVGKNLEPLMAGAAGVLGFSQPLGPGNYSFWLQENSTPIVNYQLNFVLTPDPAPAPALPASLGVALALGLGGAGVRARRRGARSAKA
jgi:hypothetical protein